MPNMMDYLSWRGDLPVHAVPLLDVDNLILASFCYNDLGPHASGAGEFPCGSWRRCLILKSAPAEFSSGSGGICSTPWRRQSDSAPCMSMTMWT